MSSVCCPENSNCCVFYRGTVYLRAAGSTEAFRPVGNAAQLRITHDAPDYLPLNGELDPSCCGFEAVQAQLALRCFSNANTIIGFSGAQALNAEETVATALTWESLEAGSLVPFGTLVDPETVSIDSTNFSVTSYGLIAKACDPSPGSVQVQYTTRQTRDTHAGEACDTAYELMYVGTNAFDGSEVVVTIPKIRLKPAQSFDWIGQSDAGEMLLEGSVIPNAVSPVWYSILRQDCSEPCPCAAPVVTQQPTLPLIFEPGVTITPIVVSASPATGAFISADLPTGVTSSTTTVGATRTITLSGTPSVATESWAIECVFVNACSGGEEASTAVDLGDGCVLAVPVFGSLFHTICSNTLYPTPANPLNGGPNNRQPWLRVTNATSLTYTGPLPTGVTGLQIVANGTSQDVDLIGTPTVVGESISLVMTATNTSGSCSQTVTQTITFTVLEGCAVSPTISDMTPDTVFTRNVAVAKTIVVDNSTQVLYQSDSPVPIVPSGVSWTPTTSGSTTTIDFSGTPTTPGQTWKMRIAAYNNCDDCESIVVREFSGTVLDDMPWTLRHDPFNHTAVTYGNGRWVAVYAADLFTTSTDGVTWTSQTGTIGELSRNITFANGLFVSGSELGRIRTSTDGVTWTIRDSGYTRIRDIQYQNGLWVAVGAGAQSIGTSTDGINWTKRTASTTETFQSVAYGNGQWVAVGTFKNIWTSPDGVTWTQRTNPASVAVSFTTVRYANGLWVAAGSSGALLTSTDGVTWTVRTTSTTSQFNDVEYANGVWMAVGNNGVVRRSTDGLTWSAVTMQSFPNWEDIEYADGKWVAVGSGGSIETSTTGASGTWTRRTTNNTSSLVDVHYANGRWVAVGDDIYST